MTDDFQKTVNLRERNLRDSSVKRFSEKKTGYSAGGIDHVYDENKNNMHKINRPISKKINEPAVKKALFFLAVLAIGVVSYWMFFKEIKHDNTVQVNDTRSNWYAVKLINGEVYYGQIYDLSSDPIVIKNVYGNYDQIEKTVQEENEVSGLRLFKRGEETNIVRTSIIEMDPLEREDKNINAGVLEAILRDVEK